MDKDKVIEFMAAHSKGSEKKVKKLIGKSIEKDTDINFKGDIVFDVIEHEGNIYFKDKHNLLFDENSKIVGAVRKMDGKIEYIMSNYKVKEISLHDIWT